ncbi:hypothetical protein CLV55_10968 [Flavobacterium aciduliphilum]|uniref:Hydrolase n=2 Tax=Flavobacterium aciduliphilum TaxID=1101402 RepID=A0A328YJP6_9FLAO|nr:hypothetical protein CLV55_10968 [Flavobacterium aciduliphilum]
MILFFTYMYFTKQIEFERKNSKLIEKSIKDSLMTYMNKVSEADYFSLEQNQHAQDYFEKYSIQKLIPQIKEALIAYNDSPKGNIYTGQEKMGDQKFIINKVKVLNHRWIIADYSNGQLWGDVLIKYFVEDNGTITFQVMDTFLYPQEQY